MPLSETKIHNIVNHGQQTTSSEEEGLPFLLSVTIHHYLGGVRNSKLYQKKDPMIKKEPPVLAIQNAALITHFLMQRTPGDG